ncbi:DNA helicase [Rubrivivax gelatinosus]|uniref:DEAD/DEAH box helicase n=1 Tax=Rubrivivax gelatinosus TaxID=28068 RepID=UPI001904B22C|nr:ATP-binding protein [Rubrivivax gelatinosus]MBK1615531.1 DNA helicase [Rubrivivax gelatinosus]
MSLAEIRSALAAELEATPSYYDFKVRQLEREGTLWRVTLEAGYVYAEGQRPGHASAQVLLDDSLDGAAAWWGAPNKGGASVLAVLAEDDQLVLQHASGPPPGPGQLIRLYPSRFLEAVAEAWWDTPWAERALAALPELARPEPLADAPRLTGAPFRWLRPAQRRALALPGHAASFLWGPPGTGKTTTLGLMLAEYLDARPEARVLLLSTTNQAVDLAVVAVDKALHKGRRERWRAGVQRLGTRFNPAAYAGREHLIPSADRELITRLARAEAARPPPQDLAALQAWSERVAALRAELRAASLQVLRACRLAAMTTTRAVGTLKTLRELGEGGAAPFDLVVFDEASQVGLAQALVLMPLGRARLFAGDPSQLSPVQRSPDRGARRWLGRSAFAEMPRGAPSVVLLDEQSRMAEAIGALVADLYYDGALRVAADALASPEWQAARRRELGPAGPAQHVHVETVARDGGWSAAWRGPVRTESAEAIAALVAAALASGQWHAQELIVLTPFRAQRALIRQRLQALGVDGVKVSTVHRAQGSEAPAVLFDPVDGAQPFLQTEEAARLINVALSRAQAKVIVWMSAADRTNPLLAPIVQRLRLAGDARAVLALQELAGAARFPANALGQRVRAGRHVGEVVRVAADGSRLWLVNERSGAEQEIDAAFWRGKAGAPAV